MANFDDSEIERKRYNQRAAIVLGSGLDGRFALSGAAAVDSVLRTPYLRYEAAIHAHALPSSQVLDLCCGDGLHLLTAAAAGAVVTGVDTAEQALDLAALRAERAGLKVRLVASKAEQLPFADASFDFVTCAGGLSYVDLEAVLSELGRILRPGGAFIFVDSLNHNPIYRINRYVHYLRKRRSRSTLRRMPTQATLARIRKVFPDLKVSYHGIFSFLAPLLGIFGSERSAAWLDRWDLACRPLHPLAFKIVAIGHLPNRTSQPARAR